MNWLLISAVLLSMASSAWAYQFNPDHCGSPLTESWSQQFAPNVKDHGKALKQISKTALKRLTEANQTLNDDEKLLRRFIQNNPPPLTHRLPLERLRGIFKSQSLQSPLLAVAKGAKLEIFTPPVENDLFGGRSCVFLAAGPPEGRERYGDVLIRMNAERLPENSWGTLSSGYHFLKAQWPMIISGKMTVTEIDKLAYAQTVVQKNDWSEFFSQMIIAFTRKVAKNPEKQNIVKDLLRLSTTNSARFWSQIDEMRLGYLEVKVPGEIKINDVHQIVIPTDQLARVCAWPESKPFHTLLGCLADTP